MRRLTYLLSILFLPALSVKCPAQTLQQSWKHFQDTDIFDWEKKDSARMLFKAALLDSLNQPKSLNKAWISSHDFLPYVSSPDEKFRIYSWDIQGGGTWHDFDRVAQIHRPDGTPAVQLLDTVDCGEKGCYEDVFYYKIHKFKNSSGQNIYLLFGAGTHGAGNHHLRFTTVKLNKTQTALQPVYCFQVYRNNPALLSNELIIRCPRAVKRWFLYNEPANRITVYKSLITVYQEDHDISYIYQLFKSDSTKKTYRFNGEVFR